MENLHVCLINDSFPPTIDGVANAVVNYARVITEKRGEAAVLTPYYPEADDSGYPFRVLRYPSVDTRKLVGYRAGIPFSSELLRQTKEAHFDIIHSHCPVTSTILARMLRSRLNVPLVFTYHTKFDVDIANAVRGQPFAGGSDAPAGRRISPPATRSGRSAVAREKISARSAMTANTPSCPTAWIFPIGRASDEMISRNDGGL